MSSFNLAKKLQRPAKKAWKSFTKTLEYLKLQKLMFISKALKKTTHRLKSLCQNIRPIIPRKLRAITRSRSHLHHHRHLPHHHLQNNFAAIYVDELFAGQLKAKEIMGATSSGGVNSKALAIKGKVHCKAGETSASGGAWKVAVSALPQVQGIDERAEEFISKFREDMKLQREQSIPDFHEMLARSA